MIQSPTASTPVGFLVTTLAFAFFLTGCSCPIKHSNGLLRARPDLMVVEWNEWKNSELETVSVQKIESDIMNQVRDWLARITPRQPPRNELGSVRPTITVTFYRYKDGERKTIAEIFEVYRSKGSSFKSLKFEAELLSESEIRELQRIVGKQ